MAYMTFRQQVITKRLIQMFTEQNSNHPLTKEAKELNLIEAIDEDAALRMAMEDVYAMTDNINGAENLTEIDIKKIASYFINHHDYSGYNDYIHDLIEVYIRNKGKF